MTASRFANVTADPRKLAFWHLSGEDFRAVNHFLKLHRAARDAWINEEAEASRYAAALGRLHEWAPRHQQKIREKAALAAAAAERARRALRAVLNGPERQEAEDACRLAGADLPAWWPAREVAPQ